MTRKKADIVMIRSLFYVIGQGIKSVFRNKWFSLATIATISACLFLFGMVFAILFNIDYMLKTAEEGVSITVFFDEGTTPERMQEIGEIISKNTAVARQEFVSAEAAWESFKTEYLGEYADGFTENPLENSANWEIYLNDVTRQAELVSYLETIPGVRKVNRSELTANTFSGMNSLITYVSFGIIGILLAVSVFLISNTVTIGISVRKEEIAIMKYIGATDFLVKSPFVIEGVIIGFLGSAIPLSIIYFSYNDVIELIAAKFTILSTILKFLPIETIFGQLMPISIAIGVGIGFFGSSFTVRRHIRV